MCFYFAATVIICRACTYFFLSRGKNQRGKEKLDRSGWVHDMDNHQQSESAPNAGRLQDLSGTCTAATAPESLYSLKDRIHRLEQHLVEKVE